MACCLALSALCAWQIEQSLNRDRKPAPSAGAASAAPPSRAPKALLHLRDTLSTALSAVVRAAGSGSELKRGGSSWSIAATEPAVMPGRGSGSGSALALCGGVSGCVCPPAWLPQSRRAQQISAAVDEAAAGRDRSKQQQQQQQATASAVASGKQQGNAPTAAGFAGQAGLGRGRM